MIDDKTLAEWRRWLTFRKQNTVDNDGCLALIDEVERLRENLEVTYDVIRKAEMARAEAHSQLQVANDEVDRLRAREQISSAIIRNDESKAEQWRDYAEALEKAGEAMRDWAAGTSSSDEWEDAKEGRPE